MIDYCDYVEPDDLSVGKLHYVQPFTIDDLQYINQYHELINNDEIDNANTYAFSLMKEYDINMFDTSMFNGILWRIQNLEKYYVTNYYYNSSWDLTQETQMSFYRSKKPDIAIENDCLWLQTSYCEYEFYDTINLLQNSLYKIVDCYNNVYIDNLSVIYGVFTESPSGEITCEDIYIDNDEDDTQNQFLLKYPITRLKRGNYEIELYVDKSIKNELKGIKFYTLFTGNLYSCYADSDLKLKRYDGDSLYEITKAGFYTVDKVIDYTQEYIDGQNVSVSLNDKYDVCYRDTYQEVDDYFDVYYGFSFENTSGNLYVKKIIDYIDSGKIRLLASKIN